MPRTATEREMREAGLSYQAEPQFTCDDPDPEPYLPTGRTERRLARLVLSDILEALNRSKSAA